MAESEYTYAPVREGRRCFVLCPTTFTLDDIGDGHVVWNILTAYSDYAARNYRFDTDGVTYHALRGVSG